MMYAVVVPVFNSASTLESLYGRIAATFNVLDLPYELIFVDDCSTDDSWKILQQLKQQDPETVKILRFTRNYGQHSATFCGLAHANADYVITIDDDLQNAPEDMKQLITHQEESGCALVYGVGKKQHAFWRNLGSQLVRAGSRHMEGGPHQGSSFRLLTRELAAQVLQHKRHFIFLDEVLFWYTDEIAFIEVQHFKRSSGKSGYSLSKLVQLAARSTLFYSTWPLKVMTIGGLVLSLLSFFAGIYFMILKFLYEVPVQGFTALIVTIFFSTSLVLLCFGIIGTYIKHMYTVLNSKPMYTIREKEV